MTLLTRVVLFHFQHLRCKQSIRLYLPISQLEKSTISTSSLLPFPLVFSCIEPADLGYYLPTSKTSSHWRGFNTTERPCCSYALQSQFRWCWAGLLWRSMPPTNVTRSSFVADSTCHSFVSTLSATPPLSSSLQNCLLCPCLWVWDREQYVTFQLEWLKAYRKFPWSLVLLTGWKQWLTASLFLPGQTSVFSFFCWGKSRIQLIQGQRFSLESLCLWRVILLPHKVQEWNYGCDIVFCPKSFSQ